MPWDLIVRKRKGLEGIFAGCWRWGAFDVAPARQFVFTELTATVRVGILLLLTGQIELPRGHGLPALFFHARTVPRVIVFSAHLAQIFPKAAAHY